MELMICFDDVQLIIGKGSYKADEVHLPAHKQFQTALNAIAHAGHKPRVAPYTRDMAASI